MWSELDKMEGIGSDSLIVTLRMATLSFNNGKILKLHLSSVINHTYQCYLPCALSIEYSALLME